MDSIYIENVKTEKSKALLLHRLRTIGFFFRATEICVALLFVFWIFTSCLPFAVKISGEFLRHLACFVSTPVFMFVLGNSIVVALLTTKSTVTIGAETDTIYEAFIRSGESRVNSSDGDLTEEEIIVFDDKQIITTTETDSNPNPTVARVDHEYEKHSNPNPTEARVDHESERDSNSVTDHPTKVYRRSKSEISAKQSIETVTKPSLRRSETEKCRRIVESCPVDENFPEDHIHMTNEEFQKTIEAFIAKQLIFRRRESLAVVIHNS